MPQGSARAVVFRRGTHGLRLLVLRAFGGWDFPKGLVEDGESDFDDAEDLLPPRLALILNWARETLRA